MEQPPAQYDDYGLELRLRRLTAGNSETNTIEYVEEIQNMSDRPVCFAMRKIKRQIVQIASSHLVEGESKLTYHLQPKDLTLDGTDMESSLQIVKGFSSGAGACDGGEILGPSETTTYLSESFTILHAGLYRVQSEWYIDILDAREAPSYKVLGKCRIKSNALTLDIKNGSSD